MLKSIARNILLHPYSRRVLSRRFIQPIWESLHKLSLFGMNYGGAILVNDSGELWVLDWLSRRRATSLPGRPAVIFDVGAHNGSYSLGAARIFGDDSLVYSFEPSAEVYKSLLRVTADRPNIMAYQFGLGDCETTASLYYDSVGAQKASLYAEAHASTIDLALGRVTSEEILVRTLDAFCEEQKISRIDVLKIDVEGNELDVLRGATRMIEAGAVEAIQFEFGEAQIASGTFFKHIHQFLLPRYRIHRILGAGLSKALEPYDVIFEVYRTTNYLAVQRRD
jgi:FkbM family methyltransferase